MDSAFARGEWRRIGLQIEPDGTVVAAIDGQVVAVSPALVRPAPSGFRVAILGKAVGTDVLVRDLAVWSALG